MELRTPYQALATAVALAASATLAVAQAPEHPAQSRTIQPSEQVILASASSASLHSLPSIEAAILPVAPQPVTRPVNRSEAATNPRELKIWTGLMLAEHSAAIFDAWSTRESLRSGNGYERNPLMRPFANSAAIYPMLQVMPVGFDLVSRRMMRSHNRLFRNTWWLPQAASAAASLWCGSRNIRVANLRH